MDLKGTLELPVAQFVSTEFTKVAPTDSVREAAKTMRKAKATEALVVAEGGPIGIVTERDILYRVVAEGADPTKTLVRQVMSAPVETVEADEKVIDAIARMSKLGMRRLAVTKKGKVYGLVTQKALVSGEPGRDVGLPELASPKSLACPYCGEQVRDGEELSRHIDVTHLGLGLLEGDKRKW